MKNNQKNASGTATVTENRETALGKQMSTWIIGWPSWEIHFVFNTHKALCTFKNYEINISTLIILNERFLLS